jgi:hypothetical protein
MTTPAVSTPWPQVLIDEAAQAAEVAALQPLVYGATNVVLVGDPQQLPATIFSSGAREVEMERSLFQRLSLAGCPVRGAGAGGRWAGRGAAPRCRPQAADRVGSRL